MHANFGVYSTAAALLELCKFLDPDETNTLLALAKTYYSLKQPETALNVIKQLIASRSDTSPTKNERLLMAKSLAMLGKTESARDTLQNDRGAAA